MICVRAEIVATDQCSALMLYLNSTRPEPAGQKLSLSSFLGHGCWYGYAAFAGVAKQEKHVEFAWHHFVMAAFLGKLVKRWLIQASPEPMPCAEWAPDRVCGLEKHFHSSVLTSGDQMQWIRRDKFFLCFRLPCLSDIPKSSLKGYCKSDGIFAKIQMSAQQFHPPECLLLLQGSFTPA